MTTELKPVASVLEPVPDVVNMLKRMLEDAESGQLRSVAVAGVRANAECCNGWAGCYHPIALIGELCIIQREVMDAHVDLRGKPAGEGYQ